MGNNQNDQPNNSEYFEVLLMLRTVNASIVKNTDVSYELQHSHEDLLNLVGRTESRIRDVGNIIENFKQHSIEENNIRDKYLIEFAESLEENLSNYHLTRAKKFEQKSSFLKYLLYGSVTTLVISLLILLVTVYFAQSWYSESTIARSELREEIIKEISKNDQKIYNKYEVENSFKNDKVLQLWIREFPKEAEDFVKFRRGYNANR